MTGIQLDLLLLASPTHLPQYCTTKWPLLGFFSMVFMH